MGLGLLAACVQGTVRPKPQPGGSLALTDEQGAADAPSGPLKVAFSSPSGEVGIVTELNVVFDRPVHPLGAVSDGPPPFRITPELPGRFRWVGSRAIVFTPSQRVPFATRVAVEVPAGLQALDGTRLAEPHRFELETRRPKLVSTTPWAGQRGVGLQPELEIELNQPVTAAALRAASQLTSTSPKSRITVPFDVLTVPEQPRRLRLRPRRPLLPASQVVLTLGASLKGAEGPLEAGVEQSLTFHTYDPLSLTRVSCVHDRSPTECEPDGEVWLELNNAVRPRELAGKVRVTPDVGLRLVRGAGEGDSPTSYVPLLGRFQAGQSYTVTIDAGVVDQFGQALARPATASFRIRDFAATVEIGAVGRNFAGRPLSVPVASRNVKSYELLTAALAPADVLSFLGRSGQREPSALDWLAAFPGVSVQAVAPTAGRNRIDKLSLDAVKLLGGSGRGALAIGARYHSDAKDWSLPASTKLISLTDLGISAKLSAFGSLVWVTDRRTNAPVAGAQVGLFQSGKAERWYATDADGLARIPAADYAPNLEQHDAAGRALLVARFGADSAFAPVSELIDGYRLNVPTDFSGGLHHYGVVFSDRGIYRPGDEVQLKGIVRKQAMRGDELPAERPVDVSLRAPSGEVVAQASAMITRHGTFASKLRLPPGAELGSYDAAVSGFGSERFAGQSLEVAEYRPVELRVVGSADRPAYLRSESATFEVKADYLFGAAAAGLEAQISVSRQPSWFEVPDTAGFTTSADAYYWELGSTSAAGELRREQRKLDERGQLSFVEKLDLPGQRGTELVRLDAEVTDVSRRSVASTSSVLVHPASHYVGLALPSEGFVSAPGQLAPLVIAADPSGKRLAGKRVTVELVERRYTYAKEAAGDDYRGVSKPVDKVVARCEATTAAAPVSCSLGVPAAGYFLIIARSRDAAGRAAEAATHVYATGSGEPTWQDNDRRSVELVLDKKSYTVGERARVLVKSPYKEAEALITVERSGVYQSFRRTLRGTAPSFEIPITAELAPNAFVGVLLLPKRSGATAVLEPGSYRVGYQSLLINADARRLAVRLTPSKGDFRPGEAIQVKLAVNDARGLPSRNTEVTLYAVDEGVLSLIDYRTPDPLLTFSAPRPLQVATLESRDAEGRIALEAFGAGRDKGRDGGGGGGEGARSDFRQTAYFNPRIVTDERGQASVSFKLPESLTTYRLMAVAVEAGDRYGFAQERVTTSKPLMARPALPRFVRAGDSFEAGVIVSKKRLKSGKVRVTAAATGLTHAAPMTREVEVADGASVEVRFPVSAPHPGPATLRFDVADASERDQVVQKLNVALPMAPESAAVYGQTSGAESQQLGDLSALRSDAGGLSVSLASTALVGVDQVMLDLLEYPYGCTEQLSSKILPLVTLGELARALGFALPADAKERAQATVNEVLARQQGDGGFAMWPEDGRSSEWVSPYATLALARAAKAGVRVPKSALERATTYLRTWVHATEQSPSQLPVGALSLDVLAELGKPDAGAVNRWFERSSELPLFAKALVLHAAVLSKLQNDVPEKLTQQIEAELHLVGDRAVVEDSDRDLRGLSFHSRTRTQALVLRALAARGKRPLLTSVARGLLGARQQGKFRTTQEAAWALLALEDYRRAAEPTAPSFRALLSLGGEVLAEAAFDQKPPLAQQIEVPLARLLAHPRDALVFEKQGAGQLFYQARLRYVRKQLPKEPLDAGFFIEKNVRVVEQGSSASATSTFAPLTEVKAGQLLLVDVTVVSPAEREYVVIDDALPAGLEAIDPRLSTTADWLRGSGFEGDACGSCAGEDAAPELKSFYDRSEVRDDRVLFFADRLPAGLFHYRYFARATTLGRFVVPPTRVEEMYEPEVFGRTGATEVVVR